MTEIDESPGKICPDCQTWKPREAFARDAGKPDGLYYCCKACHSERSRKWHQATYNRETKRLKNVRAFYNLTAEAYHALLVAQGGACAACGQVETRLDPRTKQIKNLHVDHDYTTGKVRGLLCSGCNTALGQLGDDPERIRLLLAYAERHHNSSEAEVASVARPKERRHRNG